MTKLALLLSVPIILLGAAATALAQGSGSDTLDAYAAIIQANNTANACNFLSADEQEELKHYAALSEIAAAKASSVAQMQATRAQALSDTPRCSSSDEDSVRQVMDEVSEAAAASGQGKMPTPKHPIQVAEPAPTIAQGFATPAPVVPPVPPAMAETMVVPPVNLRDPVGRYSGQARAYFLERKCNYLPYNSELDFWKLLTSRYKQMVATYGRKKVNAAQKAGEAEAQTLACGRPARAAVNDGYNDLKSVSAQ